MITDYYALTKQPKVPYSRYRNLLFNTILSREFAYLSKSRVFYDEMIKLRKVVIEGMAYQLPSS